MDSTNSAAGPEKAIIDHHSTVDESVEHDEDDFKWNFDVITNVISLYLTYFATVWSLGVPAGSIIFIMSEYAGTNPAVAAWIAAAPAVVLCTVQLFAGDLSDIFGRRWFLLVAAGFGIVGTLIGGFSTSVEMIIGGQVLNGVSISLGYLALPLLAEIVPKRDRAWVLGAATLCVGLVISFGGTIQGALMKYGVNGHLRGWRVGFYMNAGFWGVAALAVFIFYHPRSRPNPEGISPMQRFKRLDWFGIFIGTAGLVLTLLGLNYGDNPYHWGSPRVLGFLIVGIVCFAVFAVWEWKGTKDGGVIPHSMFGHRNFPLTLILSFTEGMVVYGAQTFLPQMTLQLITQDFLEVALWSLTIAFGGISGAIGFSIIVSKTREAKWVTVAGIGLFTVGVACMTAMKPHVNLAAWVIPTLIIGFGSGAMGVVIPVISSVCTPNRWVATSIALGISARGFGGSVGTVVFSSIYSSKLAKALPERIGSAVVEAGLPVSSVPQLLQAYGLGDPSAFAEVPGFTADIGAALARASGEAYAYSFRFIWYSMIPFAVLTFFLTFFIKSTKEQLNKEVASAVEAKHEHKHHAHHKESETTEMA